MAALSCSEEPTESNFPLPGSGQSFSWYKPYVLLYQHHRDSTTTNASEEERDVWQKSILSGQWKHTPRLPRAEAQLPLGAGVPQLTPSNKTAPCRQERGRGLHPGASRPGGHQPRWPSARGDLCLSSCPAPSNTEKGWERQNGRKRLGKVKCAHICHIHNQSILPSAI